MASRSSARGRQTTLRLQKQVFVHIRLSRVYLALASLSCILRRIRRALLGDGYITSGNVAVGQLNSHCTMTARSTRMNKINIHDMYMDRPCCYALVIDVDRYKLAADRRICLDDGGLIHTYLFIQDLFQKCNKP